MQNTSSKRQLESYHFRHKFHHFRHESHHFRLKLSLYTNRLFYSAGAKTFPTRAITSCIICTITSHLRAKTSGSYAITSGLKAVTSCTQSMTSGTKAIISDTLPPCLVTLPAHRISLHNKRHHFRHRVSLPAGYLPMMTLFFLNSIYWSYV